MANTKITTAVIKDDAITTAKIADDAVTGALIADDVALAGNPTTTTQSAGNNTTRIATTAFVTTAINNLVDSAPSALDTLNELAAAMGDDANFSTTVTNSIATKAPLASPSLTGTVTITGNFPQLFFVDTAGSDLDAYIVNNANGLFIGKTNTPSSSNDILSLDLTNQRLGIGASPTEKLTIQSGNLNFMGGTNDAQYIKFGDTGDDDIGNIFYYHGNNNMVFTTNTSEAMRIDSSGNVGIGTSNPLQKTHSSNGFFTDSFIASFGSVPYSSARPGVALDYASDGARLISWGTASARGTYSFIQLENDGQNQQTALTIDSSGNVGIGTSPASGVRLDMRSNANTTIGDFRNASATGYGLYVAAGDTSSQYAFRAADYQNNALFSVMGDGSVGIGTTSTPVGLPLQTKVASGDNKFRQTTANKDAFTVGLDDSTGDTIIGTHNFYPHTTFKNGGNLDIADGNLVLASGHGIDFSATANSSGSMNSELLDDYEEGTWTPSWQPANGGQGTVTYDSGARHGTYTKIGDTVFFSVIMGQSVASSTGSGPIEIVGLPYTINSTGTFRTQSVCAHYNYDTDAGGGTGLSITLEPAQGGSKFYMLLSKKDAVWVGMQSQTFTKIGTYQYIWASGFYKT